MAKQVLKVQTTVGEFSRATNTLYTHVVVRTSARAKRFVDSYTGEGRKASGVDQRWLKDRGYAVTWHSSEAAATLAAAKPYAWDGETAMVGVFPVSHDLHGWIPEDPAVTFARDAALIAAHRAKRAAV